MVLLIVFLLLWLNISAVSASPLVVIFADKLNLAEIYDTSDGPFTPDQLNSSVIGLVSPGLPNHKAGGAYANLYATLSAGDVIDSSNQYDGLLQRELYIGASNSNIKLVNFGDASWPVNIKRLRAYVQGLESKSATSQTAPGVLLVGVLPISDQNPGQKSETWSDLTPIVWLSCGASTHGDSTALTYTSDTTQTKGLIALRDIAPTILETEGLPIPSCMSGHVAHVVIVNPTSSQNRNLLLFQIASETADNQLALATFGWTFGLLGGVILLLSIFATIRPSKLNRLLQYALRFILSVPLALLIAPLIGAFPPVIYLSVIAVLAMFYAIVPRLGVIFALTALVIILDAIFNMSGLVARSLLSGYWLSGIRFYGIGNEYMGIFIGCVLMFPVFAHGLFARSKKPVDSPNFPPAFKVFTAIWFLIALVVLVDPEYGAKAGGAIAACGAFAPAFYAILTRKAPGISSWIIGIVTGFAAIFVLSEIATHFGARPTHIQGAINSLIHGDFNTVAHIAVRKAKMAVHVTLSPGAFSGIVGMIILVLVGRATPLKLIVTNFLKQPNQQLLYWTLIAGLWGILACVLFNDSGIVAALLLFGILFITLLYELLGAGGAKNANLSA